MRALLIFLMIVGRLYAQQQGESRLGEILRPSIHKSYQGKGFETTKTVDTKSSVAKPFRFFQKVFSKPFAAKEFGAKEYQTGDFTVLPANSAREAREARKSARTKSMAVDSFEESARKSPTRPYATGTYAGRYAGGRGRSQDLIDSEDPSVQNKGIGWKGKLEPMSIDDVRELLNKTK